MYLESHSHSTDALLSWASPIEASIQSFCVSPPPLTPPTVIPNPISVLYESFHLPLLTAFLAGLLSSSCRYRLGEASVLIRRPDKSDPKICPRQPRVQQLELLPILVTRVAAEDRQRARLCCFSLRLGLGLFLPIFGTSKPSQLGTR